MCAGLLTSGAKARYLATQYGLTVKRKPNGKPLVVRSHAEAVLSGLAKAEKADTAAPAATPNRGALIALFGQKRMA
jgi:hypothetical protein